MSLRTEGLAVEIAVANMDLYPVNPFGPDWTSSLEQLVPFLDATDCRNYEIHPTNAIMNDVRQRLATGDTEIIEEVIGSTHQTFNSGMGWFGRLADRCGVRRSTESVHDMSVIQTALPEPVPAVTYADDIDEALPPDALPAELAIPGAFPVVQPMDPVYAILNRAYPFTDPRRTSNLIDMLGGHGYVGICPDTVHSRIAGLGADVWAEQFRSGRAFQMHVSAGRSDMAKRSPEIAARSVQELEALTSRSWRQLRQSELGDMVMAAVEQWKAPAELPRRAGVAVVRAVLEIPPHPAAFLRRVGQHARAAENLAELIRETGATPLLRSSS